jgi:D-glycero-D-manno-heptose 1,7-bisphosphate phosphatase
LKPSLQSRAVFLDRDGILNRKAPEGQYVTSLEEFVLLPGVLPALAKLYQRGFKLFVVTNQRGIARGQVSLESLSQIHRYLLEQVESAGAKIERIVVCPHEIAEDCDCRKPKPGMILRLAAEQQLDLARSWLIGDSTSDVAAGRRAGCRTAYIGAADCAEADLSASSLDSVVDQLLARSEDDVSPSAIEQHVS